MTQSREGKTELRHEPVPGYRNLFYAVSGIAVVYLVLTLWGAF